MAYLKLYIFLGIPVLAILFFIISLCRYCYAKAKNRIEPDRFSQQEMNKRKLFLVVSSVIAGVFAIIVITLVSLLFTAVAFM